MSHDAAMVPIGLTGNGRLGAARHVAPGVREN